MCQAGEVDHLVATDAIGMGLNLDVGHVAFAGGGPAMAAILGMDAARVIAGCAEAAGTFLLVFGGVGSGLYGMLIFAILAVFIAGLMIGRTPEYLGKKIETHEMKLVAIAILVTPVLVLVGAAVAVLAEAGKAGIANPGPHGFSEILYAFTSAGNNNGSAFAGLSVNTPFYNLLLAFAMFVGRFGVILPVLAMQTAVTWVFFDAH